MKLVVCHTILTHQSKLSLCSLCLSRLFLLVSAVSSSSWTTIVDTFTHKITTQHSGFVTVATPHEQCCNHSWDQESWQRPLILKTGDVFNSAVCLVYHYYIHFFFKCCGLNPNILNLQSHISEKSSKCSAFYFGKLLKGVVYVSNPKHFFVKFKEYLLTVR